MCEQPPLPPRSFPAVKPFHRTTLCYLIFGVAWIFGTDHLVRTVTDDGALLTRYQSVKGVAFVLASGLLVYLLSRAAFLEQQRREQEKLAVFRETVSGSYHILGNYLNQMQIITLAAEDCKDFDQTALALARQASEEATYALSKLRDLDVITKESVLKAVREGSQPPFRKT
jgi:hypothetical protein